MVDPTGIIKGVAGPILQVTGGEVAKRADYIINYKDKLQRFNDLYKELEARQKDILKYVEEDEMKYNNVATESVQKWLRDTEKFLSNIKSDHEVLLMDDDDRKRIGKSFLGLWNPKKLHDFSRMAQKKAAQIDQLLRKANDLGFNKFTHSSGPPSLEMFQGKFFVGLESRLKVLREIMDALKSDINKVNRIGIFGMGGAGKTTLVEEIACRAERENFFAKVIIAEISKSPNIKLIQDCIANRIGLDLNHIQSEKERALKLNESLKKIRREAEQKSNNSKQESNNSKQESNNSREHKVLIILDNLWDQFELQHLGISYELQMDLDCKIIVVSRKKDVCQKMGDSNNYIYEVGDLNDGEAKLLFEEKIGQNTTTKEEYKLVMDDILKKCSRLPLSISVIADRLRNQSVDVWKQIVQQLDKSNSSKSTSRILYSTHSVLEMSYDSIYSEEEKMFFLLCCIFYYGERILFWNLLDYGIGIGLFQKMISLVTAIHQAREWVENLMSSSLLLAFDTDSGEIKIHDDVREAGILIAKKGERHFHIGDCSSWILEDTFEKHSIISMSSSNNWKYLGDLRLPKLQLLRICKTDISNPGCIYFERMHNIKVLDLSGSTIEIFPSAENTMQTLRTLFLDDCLSLINIVQLCKLEKLQVLSLKRSNIVELPKEIGDLRNLKLLYLTSSSKLKKIPAGALAKLSHLEGLFMKDSFKDWEIKKVDNSKDCQSAKGMASIYELKSLPLKVLELDARSIKHLPDDDILPGLSIFGIRIGKSFESMCDKSDCESIQTTLIHDILFSSRLYIMGGNESDLQGNKGLVALMRKAKTLWLENIDGLTKIVSASDGYQLSNLKALKIFGCKEMKCVVEENDTSDPNKSSNQDQSGMYDIFPNLEDLTLYNLPKLGSYVFPAQIARKPKVFPAQVARKIKVIRVVQCQKLKSIFAYMRMQKDEASGNNEIEFPSLQKLVIKSSNSLEGFCCEIGNASNTRKLLFEKEIKLPCLETLHLEDINMIRHVWGDYEEIGKDNYGVTNLKVLKISNCGSIESLCSISWILGLQDLYIRSCPKMTSVISSIVLRDKDETIYDRAMSFSNLSNLKLKNLENLTCFYEGSSRLDFPSLEKLSLFLVQKIESFAKHEHSKSAKEEDNTGVKTLFSTKKLSFPSLAVLEINRLDNIEMLWDKASLEELPRLNAIRFNELPKLRRISSEVSDQNGLVGRLKLINVRSCKALESLISELPPNEDFVFSNLQNLILSEQEYFKCIRHQSFRVNFKALHELRLGNLCLDDVPGEQEKNSNQVDEKIEGQQGNERSIVNISLCCEKVEFPSLEKLSLSGESYGGSNSTMIRLEYLPRTMLENLTSLSLYSLDKRCLFPTKSILLALQNLEELSLRLCKSFQDFFGGVDHEEDHQHGATELSRLRILRLTFLPNLKQLPCQIFPGLQELRVYGCKKFHIPVYITKRGATGELSKLQKLIVRCCDDIEAIFGGKKETQGEDHEEESTNDIVQYAMEFPSLESIEIGRMWFLRTIFDTSAGGCSYDVQLPSLQSVKIKECFNMKSFSSGTPIAPKLTSIKIDGQQIDVENIDSAQDLNSAVQCRFIKRHKVVSDWPKKLNYRKHDQHDLMLMIIPAPVECNACKFEIYREFGFGCVACEFYICGVCGLESILQSDGKDQPEELPNEIKVVSDWPKKLKYREHDQHELMLVILRTHKKCNACRSLTSTYTHWEFGFGCGECDFSICGRCGLESILQSHGKDQPPEEVPNEIKVARKWPNTLNLKLHHHQLKLQAVIKKVPKWHFDLKFSSDSDSDSEQPSLQYQKSKKYCNGCKQKISDLFAYYCEPDECRKFSLHVKCALEEEHQVTQMSSDVVDGNRGPSDFVAAQPVEVASPELSSPPKFTDPGRSTAPIASSPETLATQEIVSKVPLATTDEFNAKITAAEQAFSSWQNTSIVAAQHITLKLLELIMRDTDNIAFKITIEQEKFLNDTLGELYCGIEMVEQVSEMSTFQTEEIVLSRSREPLGSNCVEICTANLPSMVLLWMILVAITCGNTLVLKSSHISPEAISKSRMSVVSTRQQCFTYLSNGVETCLKLDKRLIFLPYHEDYHWRLLVICLPKNTVHVFDPANDKVNKDIYLKRFLNAIFKNLLKVQLSWSIVKCPKQHGNTECGYYIMHYMEDIINKFVESSDLEQDYKGPITLTYKELDEIRDKWSRYFVDKYC